MPSPYTFLHFFDPQGGYCQVHDFLIDKPHPRSPVHAHGYIDCVVQPSETVHAIVEDFPGARPARPTILRTVKVVGAKSQGERTEVTLRVLTQQPWPCHSA
jgi:hypothetical protein